MNFVFTNIIIGAIGSILAAVILYILSQCYSFSSKKRVNYNNEMAFHHIYQIENHRSFFDDYSLIMQNVEKLHKCMFEIHFAIYPFTMLFRRTSKKIIQTLLFDIMRRCETVLYSTIGYTGEKEREERLYKLQRCFYNEESLDNNCSLIRLQLSFISMLMQGKNFYRAFFEKNCIAYNPKEVSTMIDINSFNRKEPLLDCSIQENGLTFKEFEYLLKKYQLR